MAKEIKVLSKKTVVKYEAKFTEFGEYFEYASQIYDRAGLHGPKRTKIVFDDQPNLEIVYIEETDLE